MIVGSDLLMSKTLLLFAVVALLSACKTIKNHSEVPLAYYPEPQAIPAIYRKTFSLDVKDARIYVTSGGKAPSHVGVARGYYDIPHDVYNANKVSFEKQLTSDLRKELEALGLVDSDAPGAKRVVVRVRDFDSDVGSRGHFTYDIELTVFNAAGKPLTVNHVNGEENFIGDWRAPGGESLMQRQLPIYYARIVRQLVRGDPMVMLALGNEL